MARWGFRFNHTAINTADERVKILFEGAPDDIGRRCPRLVPSHDRENWSEMSCVDLWIEYRADDGSLDVRLDGWTMEQLAEMAADPAIARAGLEALAGGESLESRVGAVGTLLDTAFAAAARPTTA